MGKCPKCVVDHKSREVNEWWTNAERGWNWQRQLLRFVILPSPSHFICTSCLSHYSCGPWDLIRNLNLNMCSRLRNVSGNGSWPEVFPIPGAQEIGTEPGPFSTLIPSSSPCLPHGHLALDVHAGDLRGWLKCRFWLSASGWIQDCIFNWLPGSADPAGLRTTPGVAMPWGWGALDHST